MIMKNRLNGKTALVTGATSGIGEAIARQFAELGVNLIITGRRKKRLEKLAAILKHEQNVNVTIGAFDVTDRSACEKFIDSLGNDPIDILVNNAGGAHGVDPVYSGNFEDWDTMIDTNVKGLLTMTRLISPGMKERNSGHIINIGSIAGHEAYPGGVAYCAAKHAVTAITKSTKMDLTGTNVRVSQVSPGLVETEFSMVRFKGNKDKADKVYEGMEPLTADDIAEIVVFVANRPDHVNLLDTVVFPVAQSAATMVSRNA
jgi:NADP-dependent 3-hydroxy acid dehydrogenase YdfG